MCSYHWRVPPFDLPMHSHCWSVYVFHCLCVPPTDLSMCSSFWFIFVFLLLICIFASPVDLSMCTYCWSVHVLLMLICLCVPLVDLSKYCYCWSVGLNGFLTSRLCSNMLVLTFPLCIHIYHRSICLSVPQPAHITVYSCESSSCHQLKRNLSLNCQQQCLYWHFLLNFPDCFLFYNEKNRNKSKEKTKKMQNLSWNCVDNMS